MGSSPCCRMPVRALLDRYGGTFAARSPAGACPWTVTDRIAMTCSVSAGVALIMYSPRHAREGTEARVSVEHREIIDRLVKDVLNRGRLDMIEDLYTPSLAGAARRWITPFLTSFSDLDIRVVDVVSEGDRAAARFSCSGTHTGTWQGHPPTGRRFVNVAEVYFCRFEGGRIAHAWAWKTT